MRFGYSAKLNAFFLLDEEAAYRKSGYWQEDILSVTDEVWCEYVSKPPEGKQRGAGKDGMPAWIDIPHREDRTIEENLTLKNALLEKADTEIRMLAVVQEVYGLNEDEKKKLEAWKKHLADVYRMNASVKEKIDWPDAPFTG